MSSPNQPSPFDSSTHTPSKNTPQNDFKQTPMAPKPMAPKPMTQGALPVEGSIQNHRDAPAFYKHTNYLVRRKVLKLIGASFYSA